MSNKPVKYMRTGTNNIELEDTDEILIYRDGSLIGSWTLEQFDNYIINLIKKNTNPHSPRD